MDLSSFVGLIGFGAACALAASMGAIFRPGDWYKRLEKPAWRPPNRAFAPAWTVLYVMIASPAGSCGGDTVSPARGCR